MEKIKRALEPFAEAFHQVCSGHTEGWADRKTDQHVLFGYNGFNLTLGMLKNAAAALSELEAAKPKEPPRYVMSGLAEEAMEVRHEFAAFILNHYGVTNHAELRTHIDSLLIMFDQLVEHPKEQGAEPYAWTVRGTRQMYFGEYAESDARMEAKKIGGTAVAFPLFRQEQGAEPVPTAREKAMEEAVCVYCGRLQP